MDLVYDQNLVSRLLFSFVAIAIAVGPMIADFNATHATNPLWPPHARFHVVWQVLQQTSASGVVLFLLWTRSPAYVLQVHVAAAILYLWAATFFVALGSMGLFGGALRDVNGIEPFRFPKPGGGVLEVDTNLFGAVLLSGLLTLALVVFDSQPAG